MEGTSATCWLAYGTTQHQRDGPVTQWPPPATCRACRRCSRAWQLDDQAVVESRAAGATTAAGRASTPTFCVFRTPDYLASCVQDHRKGEYEEAHVAQVTLRNKAVIFWSCPQTMGEGSGLRPATGPGAPRCPA